MDLRVRRNPGHATIPRTVNGSLRAGVHGNLHESLGGSVVDGNVHSNLRDGLSGEAAHRDDVARGGNVEAARSSQ